MIRINDDWIIDIDRYNYTLRRDMHTTRIIKKNGEEVEEPVYTTVGHYSSLNKALDNLGEDIIMTNNQKCYEEGHKDGINTAWKVLKEILMYPTTSIREIFGTEKLGEIITKYSVEEMEEKLRDYGARQVRVGDEVVINGYAYVVTRVTDRGIDTVRCDGQTYFFYKDTWDELLRTGRHFYELEIILKALRGDDANETN